MLFYFKYNGGEVQFWEMMSKIEILFIPIIP